MTDSGRGSVNSLGTIRVPSLSTVKDVGAVALALVVLHSILYQYTLFKLYGLDMNELMSLTDYAGVFLDNMGTSIVLILYSFVMVILPVVLLRGAEYAYARLARKKTHDTIMAEWQYQGVWSVAMLAFAIYAMGPSMGLVVSPYLKYVGPLSSAIAGYVLLGGAVVYMALLYSAIKTDNITPEHSHRKMYMGYIGIFVIVTFVQSAPIKAVQDYCMNRMGVSTTTLRVDGCEEGRRLAIATSDYFVFHGQYGSGYIVFSRSSLDRYARTTWRPRFASGFLWKMARPVFLHPSSEEVEEEIFRITGKNIEPYTEPEDPYHLKPEEMEVDPDPGTTPLGDDPSPCD